MEKRIPKRRFKEFIGTGEWEEKKLGEVICLTKTGTNLLGSQEITSRPLLKMGNIQRGYFSFNKLEYLKDDVEIEEDSIIQYGDFVFNTRNTLELVGKGATWMREGNKFIFNNNIAKVTFKDVDTIFFNYLYNTTNTIKKVQSKAVGTTSVAAIYPRDLNMIEVRLPSLAEQEKIGNFFQKLDRLIDLNREKLDKLKASKSAYLEEMFPGEGEDRPKRRFKGFTEKWEEKKLGEVAEIIDGDRGINYPSSQDFVKYSHTIFLNASNITNAGFNLTNNQFITKEKSDKLGSGKLKLDDIILTSRGSLGNIAHYNNEIKKIIPYARINSGMLIIRLRKDYNSLYIKQYLKSKIGVNKIKAISYGSAQPQLTVKDILIYNISIPSLAEQEKIGHFFKKLDDQIGLQEEKLEKLEKMKKAYLAEMFV